MSFARFKWGPTAFYYVWIPQKLRKGKEKVEESKKKKKKKRITAHTQTFVRIPRVSFNFSFLYSSFLVSLDCLEMKKYKKAKKGKNYWAHSKYSKSLKMIQSKILARN